MLTRKIQMEELGILESVVQILDKNHLTYFLAYGTLLGAIRHQGFIPWDDDIDIQMPRADYEKFLEICVSELPPNLVLQHQSTEENYWLPFAKIRKRNTLYEEAGAPTNLTENGFWIDIFPVDFSHGLGKKHEMVKGTILSILYKKWSIATYTEVKSKKHAIFNLFLRMCHLNRKRILNIHSRIAKAGGGDFVVDYGSGKEFAKHTVPKDWYFPTREALFEGKMYTVPNQYELLLTRIYGSDYMQLPPPEKRYTHIPNKVCFENETLPTNLKPDNLS